MPIKLVCLNLNRRDTRQQPVQAYRPASQVNQKAAAKAVYQCTYPVQWGLYISWNVCSHLYTEHELHNTQHTCLYIRWYIHVYMIQNTYIIVKTCTYMSECTYTFTSQNVHTYHVHHDTCRYVFAEMYTHVSCTCLCFSILVYTTGMSVSCRCTIALYIHCSTYMVRTS